MTDELARRCAAAVAAREPEVAAFAWWDTEDLLARARASLVRGARRCAGCRSV